MTEDAPPKKKKLGPKKQSVRKRAADTRLVKVSLDLPDLIKERKSFSEAEAHMLVARSTAFFPIAPHVCVHDYTTGLCVRYYRQESGEYVDIGEDPIDCNICRAGK